MLVRNEDEHTDNYYRFYLRGVKLDHEFSLPQGFIPKIDGKVLMTPSSTEKNWFLYSFFYEGVFSTVYRPGRWVMTVMMCHQGRWYPEASYRGPELTDDVVLKFWKQRVIPPYPTQHYKIGDKRVPYDPSA